MNSIPLDQNAPARLSLLAAQRHLYSCAKRTFIFHTIVAGAVTVAVSGVAIAIPEARPWSVLWGLVLSLVDFAFITPYQERARAVAATIQEQFDCEVLRLPWNAIKVGPHVAPELVAQHALCYGRSRTSMPTLQNWYPPSVGTIPLHLARIVCQRTNCRWDAEQRRRYAWVIVVLITTVLVTLLAVGVATGLGVTQLLTSVLAPLSPLILIGARQVRDHRRAADRLDHLRVLCDGAWKETRDRSWMRKAETTSRALQDEIFDCRRRSPPVLDFVFRTLRVELEFQMNAGADALVADVHREAAASE